MIGSSFDELFVVPENSFTELPQIMIDTLNKITCLVGYGHIADAFEEWMEYLDNTPEGLAYEAIKNDFSFAGSESLKTHLTYMHFNYLVVDMLSDYGKLDVFKAYVTRNLRDVNVGSFFKTCCINANEILHRNEKWIGEELMLPNLHPVRRKKLIDKKIQALWKEA